MSTFVGKEIRAREIKLLKMIIQIFNIKHTFAANILLCNLNQKLELRNTKCNSSYKVLECDVVAFDGQYENWPKIRDLFTAVFINNPKISSVEKMYHLKKRIISEARKICKPYPICNKWFEQAWQELKKHRSKHLVIHHLNTVLCWPVLKKESADLKNMQ